jgi:flavin-dependent dehydrogenase
MGSFTSQEHDSPQKCDVLVIGAGPAGSAISALLAEKGWHVRVLEKDTHPRFHIGESLLPHTLPFLKRLGVLQEVDKIGIRKYGTELISPYHAEPTTLYFSQATDQSFSHAYQVRRSEFDQVLLKNAAGKGAKVHEGWRVTKVQFRDEDTSLVTAIDSRNDIRHWETSFVVDATGRDSFLSNHFGSKQRDKHLNSAAIFGHFEGVQRHTGLDEGNISLCWFDHGWFWIIPLKDGTTSVGAVCWPSYLKSRRTGLNQFLWDTIALCRPISQRLKDAKLIIPAMATGNYSYRSRRQIVGTNHIMIGDALAFIDPVFSTGVHLALNSAILGANVVDARLRGAADYQRNTREFQDSMRRGLATYSWFIYRFTQPAFRNLFMAPRNILRIQEAVLSLLAGDVFRKTPNRFAIFLFKTLYYVNVLLNPVSNLRAHRQKVHAVDDGAVSARDTT